MGTREENKKRNALRTQLQLILEQRKHERDLESVAACQAIVDALKAISKADFGQVSLSSSLPRLIEEWQFSIESVEELEQISKGSSDPQKFLREQLGILLKERDVVITQGGIERNGLRVPEHTQDGTRPGETNAVGSYTLPVSTLSDVEQVKAYFQAGKEMAEHIMEVAQ